MFCEKVLRELPFEIIQYGFENVILTYYSLLFLFHIVPAETFRLRYDFVQHLSLNYFENP